MNITRLLQTIVIVGGLGGMVYSARHCERTCAESVTIKQIGGCNQHYCGVVYSNGRRGSEPTPTIGQRSCIRYEDHWQ